MPAMTQQHDLIEATKENTMTTMTGVELRPLIVPRQLTDADAADFIEMAEVRNQVCREVAGHDDNAMTAAELLPHYRPTPYEERFSWVIVLDGRIVGRANVDLPTEEGSRVAYWIVEVIREAQGRGLGPRHPGRAAWGRRLARGRLEDRCHERRRAGPHSGERPAGGAHP